MSAPLPSPDLFPNWQEWARRLVSSLAVTSPASSGSPASNGVTDHGALTGLADDDHTQYSLVTGLRAFSGAVTINAPVALQLRGATTGNANIVYISFEDSAGTREAWIGPGSSGNSDLYIDSDAQIRIQPFNALRGLFTSSGLQITGTLSTTGNISGPPQLIVAGGAKFFDRNAGSWGIQCSNGEYSLFGDINGQTHIQYNGVTKLATQTGGALTTGTHTATDFNSTSSRRLKQEIKKLGSWVADSFDKIDWISYRYKDEYAGTTGHIHYGLTTEQLRSIFPDAVHGASYSHNTMFGILGKTLEETRRDNKRLRWQNYILFTGLIGLFILVV